MPLLIYVQEAREGPPKDIFKDDNDSSRPLFDTSNGEDFDDVKLRQYQLDRLR